MNAGAWGREIGARVRSARCLNRDGSACAITGKKLKFRYRGCDGLGDRIVVDVLLAKGEPAGSEAVRARRVGIAAKRRWWKGLRCAGSIFKNPPGKSAGRLIEQAGFKGRRVGGASVSPRHANVIVTEQGALASDVRCLIETIRGDVQRQTGVELETEVVFLE
jgi:UDP-N-acetylmuramate dehydrogenase